MREAEIRPITSVAAKEALVKYVSEVLTDTDHRLLHAQTKQEALSALDRLRFEINAAIHEFSLPDCGSWGLIRRLTCLPGNPVRLIATSSPDLESFFEKINEVGADAIEPAAMVQLCRFKVEMVDLRLFETCSTCRGNEVCHHGDTPVVIASQVDEGLVN